MRWKAAFSWRLPPRSRRKRVRLPLEAGIGATPAIRASLACERKRSIPAISAISLAAVSGPTPGSESRRGCWPRTSSSSSRSSAAARHQLRRDAHDALAAREQEALESPGDVAAVLDRPDALGVERARPGEQSLEPGARRRHGLVALQLARPGADRRGGVAALVWI